MYILDNAVTTFSVSREQEGSGTPPVPPCITQESVARGPCVLLLAAFTWQY